MNGIHRDPGVGEPGTGYDGENPVAEDSADHVSFLAFVSASTVTRQSQNTYPLIRKKRGSIMPQNQARVMVKVDHWP